MNAIIRFRRMLLLPALVATTVTMHTSCNKVQQDKSLEAEKTNPLPLAAKDYFSNLSATKEVPPTLAGKKNLLKNVTVKTGNRLTALSKIVDWDAAFTEHFSGIPYLFVPVKEDIHPFTNKSYEFFRYLVFSRKPGQTPSLSIIELLGDKGYTFDADKSEVTINAFRNMLERRSFSLGSTEASVLFYNNEYKPTTSFHVSKGTWSAARITFRSDLGIK